MSEEQEIRFEEGGEIREFVVQRPAIFVAVYHYPNSDIPYATTDNDKSRLIQSMYNWHGLDRTRPVKIYTIIL